MTTDLLHIVEHRPYPLEKNPWVMVQSWHDLLFSHWPISPSILRSLLPRQLPLDTYEGEAWIGVVPFVMKNVHPRGLPSVPRLSEFPELNVRTYVTLNDRPGVYFFSLDAGNPIAVALARSLFHLPYFLASMQSQREKDTIIYRSRRSTQNAPAAEYQARYRPVAPVREAPTGSLESWLTERYCLYTAVGQQLYCGEIHHRRWPLQAAELEPVRNTMAIGHGIVLPDTQPLLHFAQRLDVLIWPLKRVG